MKRFADASIAAAALVALAPLLAMIAGVILLADGRPVFFLQERMGRGGRLFRIVKFRSMRNDGGQTRVSITVGDDDRVTAIGRVLRGLKLDELPQLWNVLRGDMSLVGPRPEVPAFLDAYPAELLRVFDLRPGISDPASIGLRDEASLLARRDDPEGYYRAVLLPAKVRVSLAYADRSTLWSDARVLLRTVACLTPFVRRHDPDLAGLPDAKNAAA